MLTECLRWSGCGGHGSGTCVRFGNTEYKIISLLYFFFFLLISPGKYSSPFHTVFVRLSPKSCPALNMLRVCLLWTAEPGRCCLPDYISTCILHSPNLIQSHIENYQEWFILTQRESSGFAQSIIFAPLLWWLEISLRAAFGGDAMPRCSPRWAVIPHPVLSSSAALL